MKMPSRAKRRERVKNLDQLDRIIASAKTVDSGADLRPQPTEPPPSHPAGGMQVGPAVIGFPDLGQMSDVITLRSILQLCLQRWKVIGISFLLMTMLAAVVTSNLTPIYQSTSVLLLRLGRESIYRAEVGDRETVVNRDRESLVNAEVEILLSRDLHESYFREVEVESVYPDLLGPEQDPSLAFGRAVGRLGGNLLIRAKPEASVIHVSFRHPEPATTAAVVNKLVELFKEKHLEMFSDPQSTAFLEETVAGYRRQLEDAQDRLKTFQGENLSVSQPDMRSDLLAQRGDLLTELKAARSEVAGLREKIDYLEGLHQAEAGGAIVDPQSASAVYKANARLLELRLEEKELRSRYTEKSRQVVNVREQIRLVEEFLEEQGAQMETILPKQLVDARSEFLFHQARARSLEGQLAYLDDELEIIPAKERQLRDLSRERDMAEQNYQTYVKKLEEARISDEMDQEKIANISVIQKAAIPTVPVRPRKKPVLILGAFLGVAVGFGLALIAGPRSPAEPGPRGQRGDDLAELEDRLVAEGFGAWAEGEVRTKRSVPPDD
jgi:uncharacterized protein involved in exopolysaccharide biosynthesis